jgi:hypothetical protein
MQTLDPPVIVPATEAGSTVTVVGAEVAVEQLPLFTTALK